MAQMRLILFLKANLSDQSVLHNFGGIIAIMDISIFDAIFEEGILNSKSDKQRKILEASIKLFAEKGYANTSTAEIAKCANVSVGTLFNYYKTKEKLLFAIVLPAITSIFPKIVLESDQKLVLQLSTSFEEFVKGIIKSKLVFLDKNRELIQVIIKEVLYKGELKSEILNHFTTYGLPFLNHSVAHFKDNGELKDLPTEQIVRFIITNLSGFFISHMLIQPNTLVSENEIDELISTMMDGLKR